MTPEEKKTTFLHILYELSSMGPTNAEYRSTANNLLAMYEKALNDAREKVKQAFEAGWKACESHFDPQSQIGGAPSQLKADFEQYLNPDPPQPVEQGTVYKHRKCMFRYCPHPDICKSNPNGCTSLKK